MRCPWLAAKIKTWPTVSIERSWPTVQSAPIPPSPPPSHARGVCVCPVGGYDTECVCTGPHHAPHAEIAIDESAGRETSQQ